jgi:hypothetical protein
MAVTVVRIAGPRSGADSEENDRKDELAGKARRGRHHLSDTVAVRNTRRGLRESVVRALAKVGLVWAVAVLGALFMVMAAQGQHHEGAYALSTAGERAHQSISATTGDSPRTAGLALALAVLAGGATVLAVGATRGDRPVSQP